MLDYFQNLIANCASKWRPVVGYEGLYEVSMDGGVRSVERRVPRRTTKNGMFIKPRILKQFVFNGRCVVPLTRGGKGVKRLVHRLVVEANGMPVKRGFEVDHINGIPNDNRLANLRVVTASQNTRNKLTDRGSCGHRGVSFHPKMRNPWVARIHVGKSSIRAGSFATREEAIAARLAAELKYWGDDAPAVVRK